MLTRLSVGRVEPWELVLSVALLVATIVRRRRRRDPDLRRGRAALRPAARVARVRGGCARTLAPNGSRSSRPGERWKAPGARASAPAGSRARRGSGNAPASSRRDSHRQGRSTPRRAAAAAGSAPRPARTPPVGTSASPASPTGSITAPGASVGMNRQSRLLIPGRYGRRPLAGHHAGDPLGRGRLVERPALAGDRGHGHDLVAGPEHLPERLAGGGRAAPRSATARRCASRSNAR